jgi:uncharacterized protein
MIEDAFVIDATVHGGHWHPSNYRTPEVEGLVRLLYHWGNDHLQPFGRDEFKLTYEQFIDRGRLQPGLLETTLFAESDTDVAVYHVTPLYGMFRDGSSPLWIGQKIHAHLPHRMFVYGDLSPRMEDPIGHINRMVDEEGVLGFKLYPHDLVAGEMVDNRFDDEKLMFPLLEHCRKRGVKTIAVHKAVPLAPTPINRYHVDDLPPAIETFPDLTFEIVHGGFAFNREIATLLDRHQNVTVNLEGSPCYALNFADQFADMIAPLIAAGPDRLFYSAGVPIMHPDPFIRAFWEFQMPKGKGCPEMTETIKRGILGENFARVQGWNIEDLKRRCAADEYGLEKRKRAPWSTLRRLEEAAV